MSLRTWIAGAAAAAALTGGIVTSGLWRTPEAGAACCYFAAQEKDINQPGQKAFITWDPASKIASWTVQPKFEGNAVDFGMVIPSPSQPKLDEMPRDFFKNLAIYTVLMPLPEGIWADLHEPRYEEMEKSGAAPGSKWDGGQDRRLSDDRGVTVLESGVVGSLDYKIITAEKADGLFDWLKENQYVYSGDQGTLDFYIRKKWFFTVMKIDPKQMKKGADGSYAGEVTPTRFTFSSDSCVYPLRITALSVKDKTDALFYVQAPQQMDLQGDLSWMHSYRTMFLTYMLGCSANADQQQELNARNRWVEEKKRKDPAFETTKLEWAKKLGATEMSVLDDPLKNYAQLGGGALPAGDVFVSQEQFLKEIWEAYEKGPGEKNDAYAKGRLKQLETQYSSDKGMIVKTKSPNPWFGTTYMWYPHREAPAEDVKQLALLKGHLGKDQWITKFRKVLRKDEMTDDLTLVPVEAAKEQEYVRIMPTSPP
ncbi:MAG: DUF2330 domain-containing protein [Candidatus Brocadiae bacterium]|nr:DUF2330 domain-containing protein [Candidatus Brocadiia bacterium]